MPNLNRVMLIGNLTRDPEMKYLPNNTPVTNISIAINRRWKNKDGEQKDETTFVDCDAFGRSAEVMNQYLQKGRPVYVEGRLQLDQWQDKQGNKRSRMKVVIDSFQFIDSKNDGVGDSGEPKQAAGDVPGFSGSAKPADRNDPIDDDDIPF